MAPILLVHICAGTSGLLSGAGAMTFRKGSRGHAMTGNVFFVAMLALALSGTYMAVVKQQPGNILGGALTFYLIVTAWITAKRRSLETNVFDWGIMLIGLTVAVVNITLGFQAAASAKGIKYGFPPGPYYFLGSVALIAAVGDIRMLIRGGISGTQRIARHLWRMCFGLFIAAGSIFAARPRLFPAFMRTSGALYILTFLPLLLMVFWLFRVRSKQWKRA